MKATNVQMMDSLQRLLSSQGITMVYQTDPLTFMTHVRLQMGEKTIYNTFSDYEDIDMRVRAMVSELKDDNRSELDALKMQLEKYKAAVKQLSFDLEMKSTTPRAVATEADVRKQTLEMAAEFLMDYGIIKSGTELESVCEQIRKLHPSKATTMANAASKMQEMFGSKA
jgi:hypothetical protein